MIRVSKTHGKQARAEGVIDLGVSTTISLRQGGLVHFSPCIPDDKLISYVLKGVDG